MRLIEAIEITYFRSLYRTRIRNIGDITIFFGLNDSGKSNILRALNLFFNGQTDPGKLIDFEIDFSDIRRSEVRRTKRRQFISVKLTFRVPENFPSLKGRIRIEKKWDRYGNIIEKSYDHNSKPINNRATLATVTKFKNQIFFHYLPAIKGIPVYQDILERMYGVAARSNKIENATNKFLSAVNKELEQLTDNLRALFGGNASISIPRDMEKFFRGLDFSYGEEGHSLLLQKGDGVKARHLPELLRYIDERDSSKRYFIWGFEEPENSLDLKRAQEEAQRFSELAVEANRQIFLTSHSPAFYLMEPASQRVIKQGKTQKVETNITRFFVSKQTLKKMESGERTGPVVPRDALTAIDNLEDAEKAMEDAGIFAFPVILRKLEEERAKRQGAERELESLKEELVKSKAVMILVEGETDKKFFDRFIIPCLRKILAQDVECKSLSGVDKISGASLEVVGEVQRAPVLFILDNDDAGRKGKKRIEEKIAKMTEHKENREVNVSINAILLPETDGHRKFREKYDIGEEISCFTIEYYYDMKKLYNAVKKNLRKNDNLDEWVKKVYRAKTTCATYREILNIKEEDYENYLYARSLPDEIKKQVHEEVNKEKGPIQAEAVRRLLKEILLAIGAAEGGEGVGKQRP